MDSQKPESIQFVNPSKLLLLGMSSLILTLSVFLSAFAAIPIAAGVILYGRKYGYLSALSFWILSGLISIASTNGISLFVFYGLGLFLAAFSVEVVLRNINPIKAILVGGVSLFVISYAALMSYVTMANTTIKDLTIKFINQYAEVLKEKVLNSTQGVNVEEGVKSLAMLEQPEKMADLILNELPGYTMMSNFIIFWIIIFMLFKLYRLKNGEDGDRFSDKTLLAYKVPDHYIWIMITGLAFSIFGDELGPSFPVVGGFIVQSLGAFYFFQGFGLYIEFLDFARLHGILRVILVSITVLTVGSFIAIIGMFDMFINFRKFLEKKEI